MISRFRTALVEMPVSRRFRLAGLISLVGGLGFGLFVHLTTPESVVSPVSLDRLKVQERQLEIIGGKFAVEAARFQAWFDGLWVGRNLGLTVAVIGVVVALACFWIGRLAAY